MQVLGVILFVLSVIWVFMKAAKRDVDNLTQSFLAEIDARDAGETDRGADEWQSRRL